MPFETVGTAGREANRGRSRTARRARPALEALEDRSLMTGNLSVTGAQLVDASDRPITAPVVGEQVFVDTQWTIGGLSSSDRYTVQFAVDGVTLNSSTIRGQSGDKLPFHWYIGGWFATPGSHTVAVTVDPAHTVDETTYADNSTTFTFTTPQPTTLPQKLNLPIAGVPSQSWSIVNYIDVNPLPGQVNDYRGGSFVYEGHDGYDFTLPNFAHMDAGAPVIAAAAGTITQVVDGNFDRQTALNTDPANEVEEDLGDGWTVEYLHFMSSSITVQVGQTVQAGQVLGLVGSSGSSTDPHLHFDLRHDGDLVETFYEPSAYWLNPLPYQGDVAPSITDLGTTNADPSGELKERPAPVSIFPSSSGWSVWYWFDITSVDANAQMAINWYRPDGLLASSTPYTVTSFADHESFEFYLSLPASVWAASAGTWHVTTVVNGTELGRTSFQVTNGAGQPTIRVDQGNTDILDDRTTPIGFGTVGQVVAGPALAFTIENIGSASLTTSGLSLPPGFALVGSFPASIPAGGRASFMVQLASTAVGPQFGQITFQTNDPDAPTFGFNLAGVVSGTPPAGAPRIGLSGPALATGLGVPPNALDPGATLTDSSPQGFNGGSLTVSMASGGTADDRLSILQQGSGAGQIGFDGSGVYYGGTRIGTASITSGPATLGVSLNSNATTAAVQALLENITYQNIASSPTTAPRYVRFAAVDGAGLASNFAIEMVVNSGMAGPSGPRPVPPVLRPTPTPTGPPPQPGSPSSPPTSAPSSAAPIPAPSPTEAGSPKKKPVPRKPVHHKHRTPTHHRPRPHGHAKGSAKRVKNRRGADGSRPRHGGS